MSAASEAPSRAYLLRAPARAASVCCGVTKRPIAPRMQEPNPSGFSGGHFGTGWFRTWWPSLCPPHPPICHRKITGALSLLLPRLILPSGRGSGALTSLYQSSRKLSTTHTPAEAWTQIPWRLRAHTHAQTQARSPPETETDEKK
ncbi:hypothetical protein EYF80_000251 [Liparis tanakae]|uniref:Uncharacterized protein n=1 Tax=Liparis tanakae TaxID=230148 RepID=A0A4Z2JJ32_9TELE|nr:hypothetical protein EYF80_000251 [Liparis tanakae]